MATNTSIEWTDSTWNPIIGCSRVSEGCRHCYAEGIAARFVNTSGPYSGLTQIVNGHPQWTGKISETKQLLDPLKWRKPRRIFVNSMSDLFHENVTDEMRDRIFAVMALCPQHTFQVLTKRSPRMRRYVPNRQQYVTMAMQRIDGPCCPSLGGKFVWPLPNVWLGVSVENQAAADERIPLLLQTPAAKRFISAEPLLGPVNLERLMVGEPSKDEDGEPIIDGFVYNALTADAWADDAGDLTGEVGFSGHLDWVIVGGESGPGARPMHPDWARSLRDQCQAAGVPFFFKQWGEFTSEQCPGVEVRLDTLRPGQCVTSGIKGHHTLYTRVGKKAAGAMLDGREWREFPKGDE